MEEDLAGAGYNVNQSKIAIGSGGLWGKGFLNGTQTKLKYVPEQDTDFIFCTVGEEEGFVGSVFVLLLYMCLLLRLIHLSERQPTVSGRVYGYSVLGIFFTCLWILRAGNLLLPPVYQHRHGTWPDTRHRHPVLLYGDLLFCCSYSCGSMRGVGRG